MRAVIAPDSFGDTLTSVQAAEAIAAGWRGRRPDDELILIPQSDGGPGFVDVLAERFGEVRTETVDGPLGDPVSARWLFDAGRDDSATAYIECAQACGLHQLGGPPTPSTALRADTRGVGRLVDAALRSGAGSVVVGLGGSGTTDGGRGLIDALGGLVVATERLRGIRLIAASDVENPLLGPEGAAAVFGPQKGADPAAVAELERRLTAWSGELAAVAGRDVAGDPGAGAAGGLGAALLALGGRRVSGATVVADATGQQAAIAGADLLVTGEGRFDSQTLRGKVVASLTDTARRHGVPVIVMAGQVTLDPGTIRSAGIAAAYSLVEAAGSVERAMSDARGQLIAVAAVAAERSD
ncbi:glycerate kinase family protein [Williamsia sterculiae]|uniref:Glycerate kinase n=1 Tax=Williamsia sterculiae TaxID=1344003 RepID=A0A1N7GAT5_9NOCA|nr:glycerate kinase [Williamsia sterculiae]SIS09681.1 glycerate kinase [Williamsia sterculiae]